MNIPDWRSFQILGRHPYLGPDLGPEVGEELWDKAINNYWERVLRISGLGLSTNFSIMAYNTYALSCLGYLCQMFWVPKRLLQLEARALSIILKIPLMLMEWMAPLSLNP